MDAGVTSACILPLAWKIAMGIARHDGFACYFPLLCYTRRRADAAIRSLAQRLENGRSSAPRFVADLLRGRIDGCGGKLNARPRSRERNDHVCLSRPRCTILVHGPRWPRPRLFG